MRRPRTLPGRGLAALVCCLALGACGSSSPSATQHTRAVIAAALRSYDDEVERDRRAENPDVIAFLALMTAPKVVSNAEWQAAIKNDHSLQKLLKRFGRDGHAPGITLTYTGKELGEQKRAEIAAALRQIQLAAAELHHLARHDPSGLMPPLPADWEPPAGITDAEWCTAIKHDQALEALVPGVPEICR